jgi:hypothetical protein
MGPGLLALRAPDGASVTLERYPILVGRVNPGGPVPDVDLSHLDPGEAVDSHHCELTPDEEGVEVHDLGGVSGTWVDGRRLPPGGRATLRPGGTLRVAGVTLTLVPAPGRRQFAATPVPPPAPAWGAAGPAHPAPPPPSAIVVPEAASPPQWSELDLSGAPPSARFLLEAGAEAVRLEPGFPLRALRGDRWDPVGDPLPGGTVDEAVRAVRRALGLDEGAATGAGTVGDLSLDFAAPPLSILPFVQARVERWVPPVEELVKKAVAVVRAGGAVVLCSRAPGRAALELARELDLGARRPRALDWTKERSATPPGWPQLPAGHGASLASGLDGDPLLAVEPPRSDLKTILDSLPRAEGGTVIAISSASLRAAVARLGLAAGLGPDPGAELGTQLAALAVDALLGESGGGWAWVASDPESRLRGGGAHSPEPRL